ncbi:putative ribonuclease H [Rosa chinensis]|uniref:Putative ribonuclease H n=1 Tax=Rosa chinensis TaxID=74649 RepID=A0A2P6QTU7_ROSCH|nr:putative ribonuclease H [Rosa chinensis]
MSIVMAVEAIMKSFADLNTSTSGAITSNLSTTIKWSAPPSSFVKINFDGSVRRDSAASGFVIRDHNGRPVIAATKCVGNSSTPVAEATALRDSLIAAKDKGFTRVEVEGDSKLVIDVVTGRVIPPWRLLKLIEDIRTIATSFSQITFKHIYREANFVADAIANLGHNAASPMSWSDRVPSEASRALIFDVVNFGCLRGFLL